MTDPKLAVPGDVFYDSDEGKLKMMNENGVWLEVLGAKEE